MSATVGAVSGSRCTLIMVRHAHTALAGRFCGHSDPPLSEQGTGQLADLNARLRGQCFTHIFSSDLQRARQTAESVAASRNLRVRQMNSLREIAFGSWEGLDWDEVMAQDATYAQNWLDHYPSVPAPGGEGLEEFRLRIRQAMNSIADQIQCDMQHQKQHGHTLVVTHGGVIRTFLADLALEQGITAGFTTCDFISCWPVCREAGRWMVPDDFVPEKVTSGAASRSTSD